MKDVKNYEGLYSISEKGEVYSTPSDGKPERYLKQEKTSKGYRRVSLSKNGVVTRFQVHRLVAKAYIPNPENKPDVNHLDNCPSNNSADNLEWVTPSENMQHSWKQGRQKKVQEAARIKNIENGRLRQKKIEGISFNDWKLLEYVDTKSKKHRFLVECICGKRAIRYVESIIRGKSIRCSSCAMKLRHHNK